MDGIVYNDRQMKDFHNLIHHFENGLVKAREDSHQGQAGRLTLSLFLITVGRCPKTRGFIKFSDIKVPKKGT